jgi:hypothetical protein
MVAVRTTHRIKSHGVQRAKVNKVVEGSDSESENQNTLRQVDSLPGEVSALEMKKTRRWVYIYVSGRKTVPYLI